MLNSEQEFMSLFGWDDFFASQLSHPVSSSLIPARVICEERNLYRVQLGFNEVLWASVTGKMQFNASSREHYPAVGDWVLIEVPARSDRGVIHQVLNRKTTLHRKQIGSSADMQILSTNVDFAFITTSANADLNHRRLERYLAVARDAGCFPVILLTKADVCPDEIAEILSDVEQEFPDVPVHTLSKDDFASASFLAGYLKNGTTSVFIGSSGVGKSTLVNFLIGKEEAKTQAIREDDEKGRHTTTSRHLYISRYGGLIIDTPGMRELQLSDHAEGISSQFADIEELINTCRFGDCKHNSEPGCAIKESLANGALDESRWLSFLKLQAEVRHGLRKQDAALAAEDRKMWKKINIDARARGKMRRGGFI